MRKTAHSTRCVSGCRLRKEKNSHSVIEIQSPATLAPMSQARIGEIARLFVRVGTTVFGGGNPGIAVLQREFQRRRWLGPDKFALAFGLARLTPGTNFLAFCAAAGWYLRGMMGATIAVLGTTIPASVLVIWLTRAGETGSRYPLARSVISALLAAGVGTMLGAAVLLVRSQCSRSRWLIPTSIALGAFGLSRGLGLSPLSVIGIAAVAGFFWTEK